MRSSLRGPVHGRDHRREIAAGGSQERPGQGVVVDHIAVGEGVVGADDVAELGDGCPDPGALGLFEHEELWHGHVESPVVKRVTSWPASAKPRANSSTTSSMPP